MRRLLAATALTAAALIGAGCSADGTDDAAPGSSTRPSSSVTISASAPAPGSSASGGQSGSNSEVCAAAQKSVDDAATQFATAVTKVAQGDAGVRQAREDAKKIFADWAAALRTQATRATDPNLKSALDTYSAEVEKAGAAVAGEMDVNKFVSSLNNPALTDAYNKVRASCG